MLHFTSDLHFGHLNVISYCGRPFLKADGQGDLNLMNRTLIENWNARVAEGDTVFVLGDFSLGSREYITSVRAKLKGKIILIRGNHDRSIQQMQQCGFDEVWNNYRLELEEFDLYLSHIPLFQHNGKWVTEEDGGEPRRIYKAEFTKQPPKYFDRWLCGHVHEKWKTKGKLINVGVDQWNMSPISEVELLTLLREKCG